MSSPKTVATYDLNGTLREFDFTFDYLSRSFVQVSLIGSERRVLVVGTDYSYVTSTRIRLTSAFGPPEWSQVEIRRVTSTTDRLVDFQDASILRAADLNLSELQVLHVAEEAREASTETIGTNNFGHLDARGRRIVNVADPVELGDVVTRRYYESDRSGTYSARVEAVAARDKAKEWATSASPVEGALYSAKVYSERSAASATASDQKAAASAASATASAASATASDQRATASDQRATASAASATASAASAALSGEYAQAPLGVPVSAGGYSAKHWATKAEGWAAQAGEVPVAISVLTSALRGFYERFIGVPIPWMTDTVPTGYLAMDGQAIPADCPILKARYPSGYLPDMRDYFVRGKPASGRAILSLEADGNKAHSHTGTTAGNGDHNHGVNDPGHVHGGGANVGASGVNYYNQGGNPYFGGHANVWLAGTGIWLSNSGWHTHSFTTGSSGDAQARPKNIAMLYVCMTDTAIPALPTIG